MHPKKIDLIIAHLTEEVAQGAAEPMQFFTLFPDEREMFNLLLHKEIPSRLTCQTVQNLLEELKRPPPHRRRTEMAGHPMSLEGLTYAIRRRDVVQPDAPTDFVIFAREIPLLDGYTRHYNLTAEYNGKDFIVPARDWYHFRQFVLNLSSDSTDETNKWLTLLMKEPPP